MQVPLLIALLVLSGCNGDPKKMAAKGRRRRSVQSLKKRVKERVVLPRTKLFGALKGRVRVLMAPEDVAAASQKRHKVGVLYLRYEQALRSIKLLEFAAVSRGKPCAVEWLLHIWDGEEYHRGEVMWGCKRLRVGRTLYDLKGTPRKVVATMITKSRLHPNFWLSLLKVPVVHDPSMVEETIKGFVEEIVPETYGVQRYPSFTVATQHTAPLPSNFALLDKRVAALRARLIRRLRDFSAMVKKRGKSSIYKLLQPVPLREKFTRELFAEWGVTVLCRLGTNSEMMFWYGNYPKMGVIKVNIPTHYTMVVVKKNTTSGPSLFANVSGLDLDPPIEFLSY